MRKIFFCLGIGLLMATFFTVSAAPTAERIANLKKEMADQKQPAWKRFSAAAEVYLFSGENPAPTSYKELKAKLLEIGKNYGASETAIASKVYQQVAFNFQNFKYEAWTEIKSSNDHFWKMYYATYWTTDKITDAERFDALSEALPKMPKSVNTVYFSAGVDKLLSICPTMEDEAKVKSTLKRLNRNFTPRLLDNKSKWEPIVAKIRTTLETY